MLARAAEEGWIEQRASKGWSFLPMIDGAEACAESYALRAVVEPAAMLMPGFRIDSAVLPACAGSRQALADGGYRTAGRVELFQANSTFHEALARLSGNRFVAQLVTRQNQLRRLLEYRFEQRPRARRAAVRGAPGILAHLERGERAEAARLLADHLGAAGRGQGPAAANHGRTHMIQQAIPAVFMRGGTSKALMLHARDLPADRDDWAPLFTGAMGSPDPYGRQLDGMGGGVSSVSKVCIIGPSERADADVDYTFCQVLVKDAAVQYKGNCGNMSSAVGPFAVDERLVRPNGDRPPSASSTPTRRRSSTAPSRSRTGRALRRRPGDPRRVRHRRAHPARLRAARRRLHRQAAAHRRADSTRWTCPASARSRSAWSTPPTPPCSSARATWG